MNKVRNSNIEIIRIISILLIVVSHYTVFNGIDNGTLPLGINRFILEFCTLGNVGSILFVLITGYFGIDNKKVSYKKVFMLIMQILFYSVFIYLIMLLFNVYKFNYSDLFRSIFPITFKTYWFMTAYILLYIFSPYINKLLDSLTQKEFKIFIFIGLLIFSVFSTITTKDYYGNELIQFVLFYSIGAYIQKYQKNNFNCKKNILVFLLLIFLIGVSIVLFDFIGLKHSFFASRSVYLLKRNSIITILLSITIFNFFIHKKEKNINFINIISKNVLGVYLISDNFLIRRILWSDILKCGFYTNSNYLLLHMIIAITSIFILCVIVDYLRMRLIEPIFIKLYTFIAKFIKNNRIYIKIKEKFD